MFKVFPPLAVDLTVLCDKVVSVVSGDLLHERMTVMSSGKRRNKKDASFGSSFAARHALRENLSLLRAHGCSPGMLLEAAIEEIRGYFYARSLEDATYRGREDRHPGFKTYAADFLRANRLNKEMVSRLGGNAIFKQLLSLYPLKCKENMPHGKTYWVC